MIEGARSLPVTTDREHWYARTEPMTEVQRVVYRFLRLAEPQEEWFSDVRRAFERACEHLQDDSAAPLEIIQDEELVMDSFDLYGLCACYDDWQAGVGAHPLGG